MVMGVIVVIRQERWLDKERSKEVIVRERSSSDYIAYSVLFV